MKLIKKMLTLCDKMYDEPGIGYRIKNGTDYCEIIKEKDTIIIAFRGTDNRLGWKSNFKCGDLNNDNVHDGFRKAYVEIADYITEKIVDITDENPSTQYALITTGHSRGGVLAIQCAYDLQFVCKNKSCITFGTPRLGGKKWREKFNRSSVYCTRFEVPGDPVCDVPLKIQGYRKEGNVVKLKQPWWWNLGTLPVVRVWKHHPKVYMKAIEYTEQRG